MFFLFADGQVSNTTFQASKDSYISSYTVSTNYGTDVSLSAGRFQIRLVGYHTRRSVVKYDLSSIPSNAIVVSAKLKLYQTGISGSPVLYTGRILDSWGENTITWSNQPSYSTTDLLTSSSVVSGWHTVDVKSHVQKMIAGVYNNEGWIIYNNDEVVNSVVNKTFASRENSNSSLRPQLQVEYYLPIKVTEAAIIHTSDNETEDGSIAPTLRDGPGGLTYKWYNSEDSVLSTSLNLVDVPYGWYGLEVASSNVNDTFYHAFIVGVNCDVVDISFRPGSKYMDDAYINEYSSLYKETNFGNHPRNEAINWTSGSIWFDGWTLMRFNLWMDSIVEVSKAELILQGGVIAPISRSNNAHFLRVTSEWNEYIVTFNSQPEYSTDTIDVPETTADYEDKTVELKQFWNTWQNNNPENFGLFFALDLYNDITRARQVYYSSEDANSANRPIISFTIDLRKPHAVMSWDTLTHTGMIFVNLNNVCGKTAPYKYIISQDSIPDLGDLYAYVNDSIFDGRLDSASLFNGTMDLTYLYDDLSSGSYYVSVFDSTWTRIVDEKIHVQAEFVFLSQTGLDTDKDTIIATQNDAIGSLEMYVHEGLNARLTSQFLDLGGEQFLGFSEIDSIVSTYEDLLYGFYIVEDTVYTLQAGVPSTGYTLIDSAALLTMHIADTVLYLSIDSDTVFTKVLASGFAYKTDVGLQDNNVLLLNPNKLSYKKPKTRFKANVLQHMICDGTIPGRFQFKMEPFTYLGAPLSIVYDIVDQDAIPVVTNGIGLTNVYEVITEYETTAAPLTPGTYTITGTVNSSPVQTFVGYITLGYEANWNQVIDYDFLPNFYSLKRVASSGNSFLNGSFASSHNMLNSGMEGWTEFTVLRNNLGKDLVKLSTQNPGSLAFNSSDEFILFTNLFGGQQLISSIGGTFSLTPITNGEKRLRVDFGTNFSTLSFVEQNGSLTPVFTGNPSSINGVLRFQTLPQNNGFKDVITSFPCPEIDVYAKAERKLKGVKYKPYINKLHFYMDEEYEKSTSELGYRVFSSSDAINPVLDGIIQPEALPNSFGDNRYKLDISSITNGSYILEVQNEKQEKFYLRFIKQ